VRRMANAEQQRPGRQRFGADTNRTNPPLFNDDVSTGLKRPSPPSDSIVLRIRWQMVGINRCPDAAGCR
jgi:hypothetical protein